MHSPAASKQTVIRYVEAFNRRDYPALTAVLAPDATVQGVLGWGNKPLAQALDEQLNVPAYIISDVALPRVSVEPRWASAARWAASLFIILLGFAFMAWLQATVPGNGATSLQVLAVIGEFYLLARLQQRRP